MTRRSCRPSSTSRTTWGSASSPRAPRTGPCGIGFATRGATRPRATCWRGRCRRSRQRPGWYDGAGSRPPDRRYAAAVLFERLAELPIEVEGYRLEQARHDVATGFTRVTTTVVMEGAGHQGTGEDVTYTAEDHDWFP